MEIETIIDYIRSVIREIREENNIHGVVKDSIFEILEKRCTVIYFPTNDKNRGFHIRKLVKDEMRDFVYINTDKTIEQQIFTAAHEMGHVWNVYHKVAERASIQGIILDESDMDLEERVVDRFAAELLMPENEFKNSVYRYVKEYEMKGSISVVGLLKIISKLMHEYMSPFNAVRKRLYEVRFLGDEADHYFKKNKQMLELFVNQMKKDDNTVLNSVTNVKMISGLRRVVEKAEENPDISKALVSKLKADFELEDIVLNDTIKVNVPEG